MGILITPISRKLHKSWTLWTIFVRFWGKLEHGSAKGHFNFYKFCRFLTHAKTRGAKKSNGYFSKAWTRATVASEPFMDQMRHGSVHVNISRKTFKNIYARLHTFHRMGASQERAAFFSKLRCWLWRDIPAGRPADRKFTRKFTRKSCFPLRVSF